MHHRIRCVRTMASGLAVALAASVLVAGPGTVAAPESTDKTSKKSSQREFSRIATYPVFRNRPAGASRADETVAEISAVTQDGKTLIYTDGPSERIGFLDLRKPRKPKGKGTASVSRPGDATSEPTSVAVVGKYALVAVNTSESYTDPSGRLDIIRIANRKTVRSIDLGGQPDSIAIGPKGRYGAVAIENERDEEATPDGGAQGDLPQAPGGFVQVIDLAKKRPAKWSTRRVDLEGLSPDITASADPEPEYVAINDRKQAAVSLQENNGIVVIDLPSGKVETSFTAGTTGVDGVDIADDGRIDLSESVQAVPREPDALTWVDDTHVATANEGDWRGGTRGWSVFDTTDGSVAWDSGARLERRAAAHGLIDDSRSDDKGIEPEGIAFAEFRGTPYAFVGAERSNFVAVYDLSDPERPSFEQMLPTTNGPEGLLPIPRRNLLAVSSEEDDAEDGIRASVGLYRFGHRDATFPTVVSARRLGGRPIGWGALSALTAGHRRGTLYAASDSAYSTGRIYTMDVVRGAARINDALTVRSGKEPANVDIEGLFARPRGGFWVASEGETGPENALLRVTRKGKIRRRIELPKRITNRVGKWGLEGVTANRGRSGRERVYVVLQRPLWRNPANQTGPVDGGRTVRIGRYMVHSGSWDWFGYRLSPSHGDSWTGLSEVTSIDRNTLAVVERDNQVGTRARNKRIYTVDIPWRQPGKITRVRKKLAYDVLPDLRATRGWTQEKLEGLTVGRGGQVYAVTDNDALDDSTGETVFLRLGRKARVFG